MLYFE